jgi:copper chaperone CopZ
MKKGLSAIIAVVLTFGINATCFAASSTAESNGPSIIGSQTLNLDQVLSYIEKNNIQVKADDQKISLYQKQFDRDNMNAKLIENSGTSEANYPRGQYASIKLQTDVLPKSDEQNIKDAKNDRDTLVNTLKFSTEQQYMDALSCQDKIDVINNQIKNVDAQIEQVKIKIKNGVATSSALDSLNVQRSQLQASLNSPKAKLQEDVLSIKQAINMDIDSNLTLLPADIAYSKYDDSDMDGKIETSVKNSYNIEKINKNIEIAELQESIYKQYSYNDATGEVNAGLNVENLQSSLKDTELNTKINLWNSYYNLKNLEDNVTTENAKVESAKSNYNTILEKVKQGTAVQLDADSAKLSLDSENISLKDAKNNYMVAAHKFAYDLTK